MVIYLLDKRSTNCVQRGLRMDTWALLLVPSLGLRCAHLAFLVVASGSEFVERTTACRCPKRNTTVYTGELTTDYY